MCQCTRFLVTNFMYPLQLVTTLALVGQILSRKDVSLSVERCLGDFIFRSHQELAQFSAFLAHCRAPTAISARSDGGGRSFRVAGVGRMFRGSKRAPCDVPFFPYFFRVHRTFRTRTKKGMSSSKELEYLNSRMTCLCRARAYHSVLPGQHKAR